MVQYFYFLGHGIVEDPFHKRPLTFRQRSNVEILSIGSEQYPTVAGPSHVSLLYYIHIYGYRVLAELRYLLTYYGREYLDYLTHVATKPHPLPLMDTIMVDLLRIHQQELLIYPQNRFQLYGATRTIQNLTLFENIPNETFSEQYTIQYDLTKQIESITHDYWRLSSDESASLSVTGSSLIGAERRTIQVPLLHLYTLHNHPYPFSPSQPINSNSNIEFVGSPNQNKFSLESVCQWLRETNETSETIVLFLISCKTYEQGLQDILYQTSPHPSLMRMIQNIPIGRKTSSSHTTKRRKR